MEKIERFIKSNCEIREINNEMIVEGYIPYDKPSARMYIGYTNAQKEIITRTAFKKTLGDKKNVYCNYNHQEGIILGSTKSGTLVLDDKEDGLHFRCSLPNTTAGRDCYETIKRGDVPGVSFEFIPRQHEVRDGISYIKSAQLEAISLAVPFPAYEEAYSKSIRSLLQERNINEESLVAALESGSVNEDITNLANALNKIIENNKTNIETPVIEQVEETKIEEQTVQSTSEEQIEILNSVQEPDEEYVKKEEVLSNLLQELQTIIEEEK